jgi:hypothetical protein
VEATRSNRVGRANFTAGAACRHDVVPTRLAAVRARQDVIERQIAADPLLTAILAVAASILRSHLFKVLNLSRAQGGGALLGAIERLIGTT